MNKIFIFTTLLFAISVNSARSQVYRDSKAPLEERVADALQRMSTHEKILVLHAQSKFTSPGVPRLGIRQLNMDDGPHGVREELEWNTWNPAQWTNDSITAFPSLTCLAATWNRHLSAVYGNAVSEEFAYRDKNIMLGPGVNIARTPLNGRAFEYMGEDPYLAGEIVVPYIQSAQKNGVACCLKHFALNNQEIDRFTANINVSERALREIYLPAFKKAIDEADVWTVMGSYPLWNNVHMCHNDALLNGILKKEWGFDGALISDWGGTTDTWQAATGGLDIEMGSFTDGKLKESEFTYDDYYLARPFEKLIIEGKVPMSVLNDKVARVLRTIFRTAMNPDKAIGSICSEEHYAACREIGEEGIVLLKNEKSILPLDANKYSRILVVGENATRSLTRGGGSSELKTLRDISPLEGLCELYGDKIDFAQGYDSGRPIYDQVDVVSQETLDKLNAEAMDKAKDADLIIYIGGLNKNHKQDCENGDRESYDLPFGQNRQIAELAKIQSNIIVVTFGGNAYATPWIDDIQALLHCWYLGSEAGRSLANVLGGKVNPSGKLPVTFAKRYEDYPYVQYGTEAYPGVNKQVYYKEGIFVGYRWFNTQKIAPRFPFGFGLSYTTYKYGKPSIAETANGWIVKVEVSNIGKCDGKEIVQLYISDEKCSVKRPAKELKGFEKLTLKTGESKTATFQISKGDLKFWDENTHNWKVESGTFKAYVCASETDVKGTVNFTVKE
ncbi:glycoside hydrolase family 3 C-terminal domain-containing protein [uncultured Bacteroides sp.]|uniref:glycoside hydrolase family 3 C-terminal domain-containing protein n=1 Tax=uncultured Bacteroides sp. TaxID=162156 RepID=UPI002604F6B3|nr:glycoside hydrolase family 3 C-terminal domain-containing protein [uncultured Bacteroides sp.]